MNLQDENSKKAWRVAQNSLAQFLQNNSFEIWEERRIENKRLDILAKRIVGEKIFYIVFEVKHYNKVSAGNEDKFLEQLNQYLKLLILRELDRKKYSYVSKKIFFTGYLVFANDYGIYKNRRKNWRKNRSWKQYGRGMFTCSHQHKIIFKEILNQLDLLSIPSQKFLIFLMKINNNNKNPFAIF